MAKAKEKRAKPKPARKRKPTDKEEWAKVKLSPYKFSGPGKIDPELMLRAVITVRDERLRREREEAERRVAQ